MNTPQLDEILELMAKLQEDDYVPKNVKIRLTNACNALSCPEKAISLRIDESLQELDEISEDSNIPGYTRTQIWNIVSRLEDIK
nr:hypothetical protein [Nanoarchaeum sp.]